MGNLRMELESTINLEQEAQEQTSLSPTTITFEQFIAMSKDKSQFTKEVFTEKNHPLGF
jgi:hypothetical protein